MLKRMLFGASAIAVGAALVVTPGAQAGSPRDRATGGGQTLIGDSGPGSTIAFTAQNRLTPGDDFAATGQVQHIDRGSGTGSLQEKYHGEVMCLHVEGDTASIGGRLTKGGTPEAAFFQMVVQDNGEPNQGADLISFQPVGEEPTCEDTPEVSNKELMLARGNAQVYDAPAPAEEG